MARTDSRGGPETRDRIASAASGLFTERGFEAVTVADVGRAAGVSSVTVFKHFPKKEDLFFDRAEEISDLFVSAVHRRRTRGEVRAALGELLSDLLDRRHPLSGTDERSVDFFRTVARSPTLIARARQLAAGIERNMTSELEHAGFEGDASLVSAFLVAGYTRILVETAGDLVEGASQQELVVEHRVRIERLLRALHSGVL